MERGDLLESARVLSESDHSGYLDVGGLKAEDWDVFAMRVVRYIHSLTCVGARSVHFHHPMCSVGAFR